MTPPVGYNCPIPVFGIWSTQSENSKNLYKMLYSSLLQVTAFVAHFTIVFAWNITSLTSTNPPTGTCATITQTNGPPCVPEELPSGTCIPLSKTCYALATVTQSCGCPNDIAVDLQCATTCDTGCFTAYSTVHLPCPITSSSSSSSLSPTTTCLSSSSSSSTPGSYSNTIVTVTSITTITTCPATNTCTGQTITWTGTQGPFPCSIHPQCTCVLPGGTQTVTTCPKSVSCTGQTTQWTSNKGPTICPESVTCNWALPDVTVTSLVVTTSSTKTGQLPTSSATIALAGGSEKMVGVGAGVVLAAVLGVIGML
jgi:hypothetical protein